MLLKYFNLFMFYFMNISDTMYTRNHNFEKFINTC